MEPIVVFTHEHVPVGVEYLLDHQLEILVFQSTAILPGFADKGYFEWITEVTLDVGQPIHRIIQDEVPPDLQTQEHSSHHVEPWCQPLL